MQIQAKEHCLLAYKRYVQYDNVPLLDN